MRMPPVLLAFTISRFGLDKVGPAEDVLFFGGADEVTAGCLVEVLSGDKVAVGVISGRAVFGGAVSGGTVIGGAVSGTESPGAGVEGVGENMLENFRGTGAGDRINEGCSVSSDQVCGDFWK